MEIDEVDVVEHLASKESTDSTSRLTETKTTVYIWHMRIVCPLLHLHLSVFTFKD